MQKEVSAQVTPALPQQMSLLHMVINQSSFILSSLWYRVPYQPHCPDSSLIKELGPLHPLSPGRVGEAERKGKKVTDWSSLKVLAS